MMAIADMLSVNDTLLTLNIDRCNISDVGLEALAIALVVNTTLRELNISYNLITDNDARSETNTLHYTGDTAHDAS